MAVLFACPHQTIAAQMAIFNHKEVDLRAPIILMVYPAGLRLTYFVKDGRDYQLVLGGFDNQVEQPLLVKRLSDRQVLHWAALLKDLASYPGILKVLKRDQSFYLSYSDRDGEPQIEQI